MKYTSPLVTRNITEKPEWGVGTDLTEIWSDEYKYSTWRKLWAYLAEGQRHFGLPISERQVAELMIAVSKPINMSKAAEYEEQTHHDVMAHIKLLGDDAPSARGIIHLGATSQFVVDNGDVLRIQMSMKHILGKLRLLIIKIGKFALHYRKLPTLGYTHFQPAQPTTVGKRASVWAYGLYIVFIELATKMSDLHARGIKGATGTQASFLELFNGDSSKVEKLDKFICSNMGFISRYRVTGQVYPRVTDSILVCLLANLAAECQKIATDIRLLSGKREIMEPFASSQVGSSAMPYKKNPIYCERACGLAKFVRSQASAALSITAEQWLERSLDDSSARRIVLPESFMATDGILNSLHKVFDGIVVNEEAITKNLASEAVALATEKILMIAARHGVDRQILHEKLRQCATQNTGSGLIIELSKIDELKNIDIAAECGTSNVVGLAVKQTEQFYAEVIVPLEQAKMAKVGLAC